MSGSLRSLVKPEGIVSGGGDAGLRPRLEWLEISSLRIDDSYQREVSARGRRTIAAIAAAFSWSKFQAVIVAPVKDQGLYVVIDGQHRSLAALACGYSKVPSMIVDATPAEAAKIFAAVNGTVTPITILQLFRAARAANESWAAAIDEVCDMAGLEALTYPVSRANMKPYQTLAIGTLRQSIARMGATRVGEKLKAMAKMSGAEVPGYFNSVAIRMAIGWFANGEQRDRAETTRALPAAKTFSGPSAGGDGPAPSLLNIPAEIRDRYFRRKQSKQVIATALRVPYAKVEEALKE